MDNVCNNRLFAFPSKVEMAKEQEYFWLGFLIVYVIFTIFGSLYTVSPISTTVLDTLDT